MRIYQDIIMIVIGFFIGAYTMIAIAEIKEHDSDEEMIRLTR